MIKILNEAALKRENKEKSSKESDNCVPRNRYCFLPPTGRYEIYCVFYCNGSAELWVNKYSPKSFLHLLSDEV